MHAAGFGVCSSIFIAAPMLGTIGDQQKFRQDSGSTGNAVKKSVPVESIVIHAEPVIMDHCEKGWRCAVFLAVKRIVAGDSIASDEQDRKAPGPMILIPVLAFKHGEVCERPHKGVPEIIGVLGLVGLDIRCPAAGTKNIPADRLIVDQRISAKTSIRIGQTFKQGVPVNRLIHIDEAMSRTGQGAELDRLTVISAPRIIDGSGFEESITIESRRFLSIQPFGLHLGILLKNFDDGRHVRLVFLPIPKVS